MPANTVINNIKEDTIAIAEYAFSRNESLVAITLPASVMFIGEGAFSECTSLASITITTGVSIGRDTFTNTAWLNRQPDGLVYLDKVLYTYKGTMPANTVINNIREDTIAIANFAFYEHTNLISITIPAGITSLSRSVFNGCENLTSVTIPDVTSFGNYAFSRCTSLTSITISANVKSVGNRAFADWTDSQTINVLGHASQAAADAAWNIGSNKWRDYCNAQINYNP